MFQIINKVFAFICQLFGCFISNHYLCCQKHNVPNLIIDVRNNPGGHIDVCNRLVSWFIDKPTKETNHYDKVNSNGVYQSFVHCMNIPADDKPFEDYVAREGQTGFYSPSSIADVIYPDSAVHYGGRVIIPTVSPPNAA